MKNILLALVLACAPAFADSVMYTEDGIDFTLTVDDLGGTVTVDLVMDTTDYVGPDTDALHATGFKVFNLDLSGDATLLAAPGSTGDWFLKAGAANNNTVHPTNDTTAPSSGFLTSIYSSQFGPAMDGSTYTFTIKYTTNEDPLSAWSLKGVTVDATDGEKAQQWSSGDLEPGDGGGNGTPVPEPATVVLFGAAAGVIAVRRRRAG